MQHTRSREKGQLVGPRNRYHQLAGGVAFAGASIGALLISITVLSSIDNIEQERLIHVFLIVGGVLATTVLLVLMQLYRRLLVVSSSRYSMLASGG